MLPPPDALADAMGLVTAYKVEQDLQRARREERERGRSSFALSSEWAK
jgi:hypothetical protein